MSRGAWALTPELEAKAEKVFKDMLGEGLVDPLKDHAQTAAASEALKATAFVISAGARYAQAERAHLPAARVHLGGTRFVVLACEDALYKYYVSLHVGGPKPSFLDLWRYFQSMDTKTVRDFVKHESLFVYTLSAGDVLLVPAGFVLAEDVRGSVPVQGYKKSFLLQRDAAGLSRLKSVKAHLAPSSGPAPAASGIIEAMVVL